jgi:DNA polymerase I
MDWGFREVWLVDFEFYCPSGQRPTPICLVARELCHNQLVRLFDGELMCSAPPYSLGNDVLFVAYYASAELGCHKALGWAMPHNVLDLYAEFRNLTNGTETKTGSGLLGALSYFGLDGIGAEEKDDMRELAMRGGPFSAGEGVALLDYCQADVEALGRLLPSMWPLIDVPRALLRGRYLSAVALMEWTGIPVDGEALRRLQCHWGSVQAKLVEVVDRDYGVFEGTTFKRIRWEQWLTTQQIPWPRLASGQLALDDETFRAMAHSYPQVAPIRQLRVSLSQLRLSALAVGRDGRNRCLLSPFRSRTGRNQPSNSKFMFGPSVWIRGFIRPGPGQGLAYIDWSQQEFGIAAALSGDQAMLTAYGSGDPYLRFGQQAGAIPPDGTKKTHALQREQFKACVLAVQYGMGAQSLAERIGQPKVRARQLLQLHRETYRAFWRWSEATVDRAFLQGVVETVFGWRILTDRRSNARSLSNFPMQANGAEMLRLACIAATEQGISVCAPVHDALLIQAPLGDLEESIRITQSAMSDAAKAVLGGFELRSDVYRVHYPAHYMDERGASMWEQVMKLLADTEDEAADQDETVRQCTTDRVQQ